MAFFTAETYVPEVMGPTGGAATSLADIFNGMVYDSTFLLILMSSILALILGQEFSCRTVDLEITAGHSRKAIFFSKVITYLIAFNVMALVYPIAGCIREFFRFGFIDGGNFIYQAAKAVLYSLLFEQCYFFHYNLDFAFHCVILQKRLLLQPLRRLYLVFIWFWNDVEISSSFFANLSNKGGSYQHSNLPTIPDFDWNCLGRCAVDFIMVQLSEM